MALTVAGIQSDVSIDVRQVLVSTDSKLIGWIDRIHKDCLHSSVYSYLNINFTNFSTAPGQQLYTLSPPTSIRRILGVYDQTRERMLFPIEKASSPVSQVEKQEPGPGQQGAYNTKQGDQAWASLSLQTSQPEYFRHVGGLGAFFLTPTPQQVAVIFVHYEQQVATLVNPTDTLLIPEDGRHLVVSGVNWLANAFLKRVEEAQAWFQTYTQLKSGITLS